MDLITHLPTPERFTSVLRIIDRFSKYVTFIPYKATCTAPELARMFYDHIFVKFGIPQIIVSDRDSRFLSKLWQALMHLLQCTLAMSSGYHPQIDGQSEHFHHSVEQIVYCYVTAIQSNWVLALAFAAFALNSTISMAHGKSPFVVLFKREPTLTLDLAVTKLANCTVQAVSDFISYQQKSFSDVHIKLAKTNEFIACSADKHHHNIQFHSGGLVYVNTTHFSLSFGLSRKLAPKWVGPFPIEQVISSISYIISLPKEYGHIHLVFFIFPSYIDTKGLHLHAYLLSFQQLMVLILSIKLRTSQFSMSTIGNLNTL